VMMRRLTPGEESAASAVGPAISAVRATAAAATEAAGRNESGAVMVSPLLAGRWKLAAFSGGEEESSAQK
jgi:hypothetical protein